MVMERPAPRPEPLLSDEGSLVAQRLATAPLCGMPWASKRTKLPRTHGIDSLPSPLTRSRLFLQHELLHAGLIWC